jgi:hypothetical protein
LIYDDIGAHICIAFKTGTMIIIIANTVFLLLILLFSLQFIALFLFPRLTYGNVFAGVHGVTLRLQVLWYVLHWPQNTVHTFIPPTPLSRLSLGF